MIGVQELHPRLKRHVNARLKSLEAGIGIDWATGEVRNSLYILMKTDCTFRLWHLDR